MHLETSILSIFLLAIGTLCHYTVDTTPTSIESLSKLKDFKQSTSCGGVLEGPAGVINYKVGQNYTDGEVCVWTILAKLKKIISLRLITDGLNKDDIQVFTTEWYTTSMESRVTLAARIKGGTTNVTEVEGDLIYIVFGAYNTGTGFSLLFEGIEDDTSGGYSVSHKLSHEDNSDISSPNAGSFIYDSPATEETFLEIVSHVIGTPAEKVTTLVNISDYVTEHGENVGDYGVWWPSLTVHQFQPGSPPNVFQLLGVYHTDDSVKSFKVNRPVLVYSVFRRDHPAHLEVGWSREGKTSNSTANILL